jgi:hypothetical protein
MRIKWRAQTNPSPAKFTLAEGVPMLLKRKPRKFVVCLTLIVFSLTVSEFTSAQPLPNPVLYLKGTELFRKKGKAFIRYRYDVLNKTAYPAAMFAAAPKLRSCGAKAKSSRTWVVVYDNRGRRLNVFCTFGRPRDLAAIWFAVEEGVLPPSYVYIELTDRRTKRKYKSNLADTAM